MLRGVATREVCRPETEPETVSFSAHAATTGRLLTQLHMLSFLAIKSRSTGLFAKAY